VKSCCNHAEFGVQSAPCHIHTNLSRTGPLVAANTSPQVVELNPRFLGRSHPGGSGWGAGATILRI